MTPPKASPRRCCARFRLPSRMRSPMPSAIARAPYPSPLTGSERYWRDERGAHGFRHHRERDDPAVPADASRPSALDLLHDELGLTGTKFGCGMGICRACTVAVRRTPARAVRGHLRLFGHSRALRRLRNHHCGRFGARGRPRPAATGVSRCLRVSVRLLRARLSDGGVCAIDRLETPSGRAAEAREPRSCAPAATTSAAAQGIGAIRAIRDAVMTHPGLTL